MESLDAIQSTPAAGVRPARVPDTEFLRRGVSSPHGPKVEWTEYGKGFPLLISAPAAIPAWYWEPFMRTLGEHFRMLLVHPRGLGHGQLPKDLRAMTVNDHAQDLRCVIEELGFEDYAVLGHCIGAAPVVKSLSLLSRRPRLVIIVSALLEMGNATQNLERVVERIRADPRLLRQYALVAAAYAPDAFRREFELRLQSADELEAHVWAVQSARLYSYADAWPADVSAVFVTSTGDLPSIRTSTATYASRLGTATRGHYQLEGGHFILLERPELGLCLVREALDG